MDKTCVMKCNIKVVSCLVLITLIIGCTKHKTNDSNQLAYTFLKDNNTVNPLIQGVWKSIGNGYYLEARQDSILLYSFTKNFCYKEKNDYLEGLLNTQSQFIRNEDTLGIYLTDFGNNTKNLQTKKDFVKVDKLPENTIGFTEMTQLDPEELFKLYMETIQGNYAFNKRRNLDWDTIFNNYKDSITADNERLFNILGEIATLTEDQHTKVISENGKSLQYRVTPSAKIVEEAFYKQSDVQNLNDYFNMFFEHNYKNITDSLLHGTGEKTANGKLEWGHLTKDVGYIHIHSFSGFLGKGYTRKQQIDSLNMYMQKIIGAFQNKKAIVLDVSFNFGGYDATALTIAGYFTDMPVLSHTSQVYNNGKFHDEDVVTIYPADSTIFNKPVYVLMTDISRSAAEGFAMMMGALPNVKLVGSNTLGTLSGMLGKSIGDFYTTYSNQRLIDSDGKFYEVSGVEPDIELNVFSRENAFNGHRKAVYDIIELVEKDH